MTAMRRALESLFTRVLRSRLGVAITIAVLVFAVIGSARMVAGPADPTSGLSSLPSQPITTVNPEEGDDGVIASPVAQSPKTLPGELTPEQIASRFTTAWLGGPASTAEKWQASLRPLSTPELIDKLNGADPASVPPEKVIGPVTLRPRTEAFAEVFVPLVSGRLRLELVAPNGRWLVDAVDWERT
ncbi:hypothetical protein E1193_12140 [Micromonospora sp. KC606]|uniref:hypothetical protein n=1 Tax=Micromonospora sp. KC606 TaxID=2530379 RepID=UPI001049866E|nr:hypothetical protein [Micromonospora sp. KC606]TDC82325.1 hypothetical protein E1193_12140 [Micromonospora sp. KC606]